MLETRGRIGVAATALALFLVGCGFVAPNAERQASIVTTSTTTIAANRPANMCSAGGGVSVPECRALLAIHRSAGGENWPLAWGWLQDADVCGWQGVVCEDGSVTELYLAFWGHLDGYLEGHLPPEIEDLSHLRELTVSATEVGGQHGLTSVPSEIGQLTQLEVLSLEGNALREVPSEIGQLRGLRELNLSGNHLSMLPTTLGELSLLESLSIQDNGLQEIGFSFERMNRLEVLYLQQNHLGALPPSLTALESILVLSLAENPLGELPLDLWRLDSLEWLDLTAIGLRVLPPEVSGLSGLEELDLDVNQLEELPDEIGEMSSLRWLDLGRNELRTLPSSFGNLANLQWVSLEDNQIVGDVTSALKPLVEGIGMPPVDAVASTIHLGGMGCPTSTDASLREFLRLAHASRDCS